MESTLICVYTNIYCVAAEMSTLLSISDRLSPYVVCRKMEKRSLWGKMEGELFDFRHIRHFPFLNSIYKVLFPICTLTSRVNNFVSRQEKDVSRRKESTNNNINLYSYNSRSGKIHLPLFLKTFFHLEEERNSLLKK